MNKRYTRADTISKMCFQFYYDKTQGCHDFDDFILYFNLGFKKDFACTTNFGSESYEGEEEV